ncbi:MAG TPA: hemerythrin domain-containing protein [Chitinophagaceae bacterium]|nr:hemerythrin domain-containing protein [Chitinophagaceae bacterium]
MIDVKHDYDYHHSVGETIYIRIDQLTIVNIVDEEGHSRSVCYNIKLYSKILYQMQQSSTPIKRSPQLTALSKEHHDGLLFVRRLRQGLINAISPDRLLSYTLWYWQHHIKPHFFQEEKILLPYMPDHPLGQQLKDEHEYIRELILSLDKEADNQDFTSLCDLIERHIRFEERQVFVYLEAKLSTEELNKVQQTLTEHPVSGEVWEDEFWNANKF